MSATYLGSLTIGGAIPGGATVALAGATGINAALPDLMSQLAGLLSYTPTPINLAAQLSTLQAMITGIELSVSLGIVPPSLATQLASIAALIASLQAVIAGMNAQLAIIADFQAALGAAGVHAIAFEGLAGALPGDVGGALSTVPGLSPADPSYAILLLTTVPATWAALASIMKVTA